MTNGRMYWLPCTIARGGFSDELVFRVPLDRGDDLVGVAPRGYCRLPDGTPIPAGRPAKDEELAGLIACRPLPADGRPTVPVSLPDGQVVLAHPKAVRPAPAESPEDVLV